MENKFVFSRSIIERILPSPPGKRYEYYDLKTPYLILRVTDKGIKTFAIYRKFRDKIVKITIGHYPEISIDEARAQAHEINSKIARGIDPRIQISASTSSITFGQLFGIYINDYAKHHCKSWRWMQAFRSRYMERLSNMTLSEITTRELQVLHNEIASVNGKTTANRTIELIRAAYNRAIKWGIYDGRNPASNVVCFKLKSRDKFIDDTGVPGFYEALEKSQNQLIKDFILLCIYTVARSSNVMQMRWDQISFERQTWKIPETKNGEPHVIALIPEALEILERRYASRTSEWVLPSDRSDKHITRPHRTFKRIAKAAGIEDLRIHDLRRTLPSWQAITGTPIKIISDTLNHKDAKSTDIYARLILTPIRKSMVTAVETMLSYTKKQSA